MVYVYLSIVSLCIHLGTACIYNVSTCTCVSKLTGHLGEISKVNNSNFIFSNRLQVIFNPQGTRILTASSDKTARLWDPLKGECLQIFEGHSDEIFSAAFNYEGDIIITGQPHPFPLIISFYLLIGSKDNTCRLWR